MYCNTFDVVLDVMDKIWLLCDGDGYHVKVMLEYDFWDTQAERQFLYLRQQLLDFGKGSHQALKLWRQNTQKIMLKLIDLHHMIHINDCWNVLTLIKNMPCIPTTVLNIYSQCSYAEQLRVLWTKDHHPYLRLVQLPSSGGTCMISLLDRSRVDSLFRIFSRTASMLPTWLLLIKIVSRDEIWYNTSGNNLNLVINENTVLSRH